MSPTCLALEVEVSVDVDLYRAAMSQLATGVTVVSTRDGDRHELMTANAVLSVSLRPTLLLVSVAHQARWLAAVRRFGRFAVNVLGRDHEGLARWCADRARHHSPEQAFDFGVETSDNGVLTLSDALAVLECHVHDEHRVGDHTLVIGEVDWVCQPTGGGPLVFFDRAFTTTPDAEVQIPQAALR